MPVGARFILIEEAVIPWMVKRIVARLIQNATEFHVDMTLESRMVSLEQTSDALDKYPETHRCVVIEIQIRDDAAGSRHALILIFR